DSSGDPFALFTESVEAIRSAAPDPLVRALGTGSFSSSSVESYDAVKPSDDFQDPIVRVRIAVSDDLESKIRMRQGHFPADYAPHDTATDATTGEVSEAVLEVALAQETADRGQWRVGE